MPAAGTLGHLTDHDRINKLGTLGYTQVVAPQGSIGTGPVQIGTLTLTVTVGSGRRVRVSGQVGMSQTGSAGLVEVLIYEGASPIKRCVLSMGAAESATFSPAVILAPSAGSHTYRLVAVASAGTATTFCSATDPNWILVEDVGV